MAVVLEAIWSDGQSKSETDDQVVPFEGDWSDGQSVLFVVYTAAVGVSIPVLLHHYQQIARNT